MLRVRCLIFLPFLTLLAGCLGSATETLLPVGTSFVVQGTMTLANGNCLTWVGDNGINYHLYQDPLLDSATFDRVTAPGAVSRLVIATRSDLDYPCGTGTVVEVQQVLQVSP
jgi:hypothetical protein